MKPLKLIIHNHKHCKDLLYTPTAKIQLVLGSNMSGKSTLLRLLLPYPEPKTNFDEGGYTELTLIHDGDIYKLRSTGTTYSLQINAGENLNHGGGISLQQKLVLLHFGIDREVQRMALGMTKFTEMSPTKRKMWAIRLSQIDYDYIQSLFSKIKEDHQYKTSVVKYRLSSIENLVVTDIEGVKAEYEELKVYANFLSTITNPSVRDYAFNQLKLNEYTEELDTIESKFKLYTLPDDLDDQLSSTTSNLAVHESAFTRISEEIDNLGGEVIVSRPDLMALESAKLEIETLTPWSYNCDISIGHSLLTHKDWISTYLIDPINETTNALKERVDALIADTNLYNQAQLRITDLQDIIEHSELAECPKCEHEFVPGVNIEEYKLELTTLCALTLPDQTELVNLESDYTKRSNFDAIQDAHLPLSTDLTSRKMVAIEKAIEEDKQFTGLSSKIREFEALKSRWDEVDHEVLNKATEKLSAAQLSITTTRARIDYLKGLERNRAIVLNLATKMSRLVVKIAEVKARILPELRIQRANIQLRETEERLSILSKQIETHLYKSNQLATVEEEVTALKEELADINILKTSFSANKGFVFGLLNEFQNGFVGLINQYIDRIWTEDFKVSVPDVKMHYKVKAVSQSPDILETSLGQQDLLNFVFRLATIKILNLDLPLFMDEVGVRIDAVHRASLYEFINRELSTEYNVVFIISHYEKVYGMFESNTEINVLDGTKIDRSLLPVRINTALNIVK
jgi:hypothetical protein